MAEKCTCDGARIIPLTRGLSAIVDEADFVRFGGFKWTAHESKPGQFYAARCVGTRKTQRIVYLHREILGLGKGEMGDHRNGDRLDNRRKNLRRCTPAGNARNCGKKRAGTSRYKGVFYARLNRKWTAQITVDRKTRHLGMFPSEEAAAEAYDRAARELHGEFARLAERREV